MSYDVFNGDADGLCALQQLRLHQPIENSCLITGPKRETSLLQKVLKVDPTQITVLDVSLRANLVDVERLLHDGHRLTYIDHHNSGPIPEHKNFSSHIDNDPATCTSVIVNKILEDKYRAWAITAAFGDNLADTAQALAQGTNLKGFQVEQLQELGELLNYNGYGRKIEDLWFSPAELFQKMQTYQDPLDFYSEAQEFSALREGYAEDLRHAEEAPLIFEHSNLRIYLLPDAAWSHRIVGAFCNLQARNNPEQAQVVMVEKPEKTHLVSVRAPKQRPVNADEICLQFEGGGRPAAAGINDLPQAKFEEFQQALIQCFCI
jgi:hypothetical protein